MSDSRQILTPELPAEVWGGCSSPSNGSAIDTAFVKLAKAIEEYIALLPPKPTPTGAPQIVPTLRHAAPSNFHLGYNMMLDAGGYMPGKIPVVVVPARPEDLERYARKRTVRGLLAALKLSPNAPGEPRRSTDK